MSPQHQEADCGRDPVPAWRDSDRDPRLNCLHRAGTAALNPLCGTNESLSFTNFEVKGHMDGKQSIQFLKKLGRQMINDD